MLGSVAGVRRWCGGFRAAYSRVNTTTAILPDLVLAYLEVGLFSVLHFASPQTHLRRCARSIRKYSIGRILGVKSVRWVPTHIPLLHCMLCHVSILRPWSLGNFFN
jgi:hypothetical protein